MNTLANQRISIPFGIGIYLNSKERHPYIRVSVVIALLAPVAIFLILRYTRFRRGLYATGGSQQSAALLCFFIVLQAVFARIKAKDHK